MANPLSNDNDDGFFQETHATLCAEIMHTTMHRCGILCVRFVLLNIIVRFTQRLRLEYMLYMYEFVRLWYVIIMPDHAQPGN